jgi:hypothetical protein
MQNTKSLADPDSLELLPPRKVNWLKVGWFRRQALQFLLDQPSQSY